MVEDFLCYSFRFDQQEGVSILIRKIIAFIVLAFIMTSAVAVPAYAADDDKSFKFELSVDGQESKEVQTGDIITVVLHCERTDADESYTMYAMQDEIRYDSTFFELVPSGVILSKGIRGKELTLRDNHKEYYMNFLSLGGGEEWNGSTLVGLIQLKVIGTSGVSKITNEDFKVSLRDGSGSYECEANELTVFVSTECTIRFESNGGSAVEDVIAIYGEKLEKPADPVKEGKYFAGWYKDIDLREEWDFENDTVSGNMTLYAKWSNTPLVEPSEPEPAPNNSVAPWIMGGILLLLLIILLLLWLRRQIKGGKQQ